MTDDASAEDRREVVRAVKGLIRDGLHVVPMRGKRPVPGMEWRNVPAPTEADAVRLWNVPRPPGTSIVCKQRGDGLWVGCLDVDDLDLAERVRAHVQDRFYCETSTSGGVHVPFLSRERVRGRKLVTGKVDLKGAPGLVVSWPTSGYVPLNDLSWATVEDGALWSEMIMREVGESPTGVGSQGLHDIVAGGDHTIPHGDTHFRLTQAAGVLRRLGFEGRWLFAALQGINQDRCETPLPDDELLDIVRWQPPQAYQPYVAELYSVTRMHPNIEVPEAPPDLIDGFLPGRNWMSFLYGGGGSGKSQIALLAAVCLATGRNFMGAETQGPMPVIYADWELDADEFKRRVKAVCAGLDVPVPRTLYYLQFGAPISDPRIYEKLSSEVVVTGARFVVLDSISFALAGMNMSESHAVVPHLQRIKLLDTPTLVIAHESKIQMDNKGRRESAESKTLFGSVMQFNFSRNVWHVVHGEEGYDHMGATLFHTKATSGAFEGQFTIRIDGVRTLDELTFTLDEGDTEKVVELLRTRPWGVSVKDIADVTSYGERKVQRIISALRASEGIVEVRVEGQRPYYALNAAVEAEEEEK